MEIELHTINYKLCPLEKQDAPGIFALRSSPEVNRYLVREPAKVFQDAVDFIENIRVKVNTGDFFYWAVHKKEEPGLKGTVCLFNIDKAERKAEIGYELLPHEQGKGIMKEILPEVISFAVNSLGIKKLDAILHPLNKASIALLEKNGFTFRESLRDDELRYAITYDP